MKRPYTFILVLLAMIIVYPSYSQFTGGCGDGLDSDIVRSCTPTECAPNAGTFMQASVVPDYGGVIFPCPTSLVSYANSFRFTGVASNLTGEYRVTIKLDPAEYIENLSLPAVPAYFTGTSTSASIDIPSTSPVASSSFAGKAKLIIYDSRNFMKIQEYDLSKERGELNIDVSKLKPGIYIYEVIMDGNKRGVKRMVVIR